MVIGSKESKTIQQLLNLPSKKVVDDSVTSLLMNSIAVTEKNEKNWANKLISKFDDFNIIDIHHSTRMVKCSLKGFHEVVLKSKGKKDNPIILENAEEFLKIINYIWDEFETLEKGDLSKISNLGELTQSLERHASDYIKIGRKMDINELSVDVVNEFKNRLFKISCEV